MPYLDKWETSVKERDGFTDSEKQKMLLSQATLSGLRMTSMTASKQYYIMIIIELTTIVLQAVHSLLWSGISSKYQG